MLVNCIIFVVLKVLLNIEPFLGDQIARTWQGLKGSSIFEMIN